MSTTPKSAPLETPTPTPDPQQDNALAAAILALVKQNATSSEKTTEILDAIRANTPKRVPDFAEIQALNPPRVLLKPAYQNGREIDPRGLSDEVIKKLSELKPGVFLGGLLEITEGAAPSYKTYLHYKISNPNDKIAMIQTGAYSSLSVLVNRLWDEQAQGLSTAASSSK